MAHGKTIKIYLIDGNPNGRMTCELSNWTGLAYKIPRINIKDCSDRKDIENTGIYFLFGKNEKQEDCIYIGEAENIYTRLTKHVKEKDFWNEAIMFITKDNNLNKAHIKYLENRFYDITTKTDRYKIENSNIPTQSSLSESDVSEMEEFIINAKILVNALGHKVFEEKVENTTKNSDIFMISAARGARAKGIPTPDGFVVLAGSSFATTPVASMSQSLRQFREKLLLEKALIESDGNLILKNDFIFSSPSTAAAIVMGRNANGLTEWKQKSGKCLKEIEQ